MTADIKLPPLPDPLVIINRYGLFESTSSGDGGVFTAEQMTAYATAAVLADRERVEGVMRMALEALRDIGPRYCAWFDEVGSCASCGERSYRPHAPHCKLNNAIAALREHLKEKP